MTTEADETPRPSARERFWSREAPVFRSLERIGPLAIPLAQHSVESPIESKPIGTPVARGERLTPTGIETAAAALSPVSGRIVGVREVTLLNRRRVPAVIVEPEKIETEASPTSSASTSPATPTPLTGLPPHGAPSHGEQTRVRDLIRAAKPAELALWIDRLRGAGIWADRRASPDLLSQLHAALRRPIDSIVCSMLDSDPALPLNAALGAHYPWQIAAGAALLAAIVGARHTTLVIDMDAPSAWSSALRRLRPAMRFHIASIRNDYPQPDPTLLIYTLLNRRLRPGRLPVETGAIQIDAAAALAIGRMIYDDAPMLSVPLAARDRVRDVTHFLDVPIGAPIGGVLLSLGTTPDEMVFRAGEHLRDQRVDAEAIVAGGELIVDAALRDFPVVPDPCIRCGWCVEMCPTRVEPAGVLEAAQRGDLRKAEHYGLEACIECGICSYVCPSHLPLLEGIRILRK